VKTNKQYIIRLKGNTPMYFLNADAAITTHKAESPNTSSGIGT